MPQSRGIAETLTYPLMSALRNRRSRRVSRGTSVLSGDLSYTSANTPAPLSQLEQAMLIVATGLTGITTHDGPLDVPGGGKELATPFLNITARAASSPDNSQPTRFFMIDDEGIWLLRRLSGAEASAYLKDLPPRWEDWSDNDWIAAAAAVKQKVSDRRLEFPRAYPFYLGWNRQLSNHPGSTMFMPVTETTHMYVNGLLNILAEPDGQRPLWVDDWQRFRPRNLQDWGGWIASRLGLVDRIQYQPVGGVKRARGGFANPKIPGPFGVIKGMLTDHEAFFLQQNLMLVAQAMGLGGWVHVCPPSPYVFQRDEAKGWHGLGFRMEPPAKKWSWWPPLPAPMPNPVGIDGVLEGLCPPYVTSMDDIVDRVLEGKREMYASPAFARQYRSPEDVQRYWATGVGYSDDTVKYVKEICHYLYDTYGRFPAHVDAWTTPGTWVQVAHVELEYYERYFDTAGHRRQFEHASLWEER